MRGQGGKAPSQSAFQHYEHLGGWEEQNMQEGDSIFKQLKHNLHTYEKNYNPLTDNYRPSHAKFHSTSKHFHPDKENTLKLPSLHSTSLQPPPHPEHPYPPNKPSLQQEPQMAAKKSYAVLIELARNNRSKYFCEITNKLPKTYETSAIEDVFLKKPKHFGISRTLKISKLREKASSKLIDYNWSDLQGREHVRQQVREQGRERRAGRVDSLTRCVGIQNE